jgi:hypothetical protein
VTFPPAPPRPDLPADPLPAPAGRRRRRSAVVVVVVAALVAASFAGQAVVDGLDTGTYEVLAATPNGPVRWNPCQPVRYQVNLAHAPPGAMDELREAIRRTEAASGVSFHFDGATDRTPAEQAEDFFMSELVEGVWFPVLIAWLPRREYREMFERPSTDRHSLAVAVPIRGEGVEAVDQYASGLIAVDADARLPRGFGSRYSLGLVLMHELGHLLGLDHVRDPGEVMFSSRTLAPNQISDWGPGDRRGLQAVGAAAGCMDPVEVRP